MQNRHQTGCLICGKPLVYEVTAHPEVCELCGETHETNAACEDGHYVCDGCHVAGNDAFHKLLLKSSEKDPIKLFLQIIKLQSVHMHGPEHHSIVPCVLLTAYRNNGGEIELERAMDTAGQRGEKAPGGICGLWGACGAAIGAGIYASIITGSVPLNTSDSWSTAQRLTARCLDAIAEIGGPRCCKRTSRISIETAVQFTKEHFHISIPVETAPCAHYDKNNECIRKRCPYYSVDGG